MDSARSSQTQHKTDVQVEGKNQKYSMGDQSQGYANWGGGGGWGDQAQNQQQGWGGGWGGGGGWQNQQSQQVAQPQ